MDGKSQENFGPGRKAVHYEDGAENDGQLKDRRIPTPLTKRRNNEKCRQTEEQMRDIMSKMVYINPKQAKLDQ